MKKIIAILIVCMSVLSLNVQSKTLSEDSPVVGSAAEFVINFMKNIGNISYDEAKKNFTATAVKPFSEIAYNRLKEKAIKFDENFKYKESSKSDGFIKITMRYSSAKGTVNTSELVKKINGKWMFADEIADKEKK